MPLGDTKFISNQIIEAFQDVGQIALVKPLLFEETNFCSDLWLITFETTEDPDITKRIRTNIHIGSHKVFTEWKEAPKICYYCDKEGHIKRDCNELKASIETRRLLREAKEQREKAKEQ